MVHDVDPASFTGETRAEFERFLAILDATEFVPFPEEELGEQIRLSKAGHNMNVIEGNEGTPLTHAMANAYMERRVPGDVAKRISLAFFSQR